VAWAAPVRKFVAPPPTRALEPGRTPSFAILIATYQSSATIVECVESALGQTRPAEEVIVIDDGSTDGTEQVLSPYRGRITYTRQDNRGKASAINAGARLAGADFVSILDADDVYEPERIEALTELAVERPDLDILMTDAYLEVEGEIVGRFLERTPFAATNQSVWIFEDCYIAWPALRRERLLELGGFDESPLVSPAEDWECWIRMLHAGSAAGLVDQPLLRYRIGTRSLTGDRLKALRSRVHILELASKLDLSADERRALDHFLARRRRRLLLAEAERALRAHDPDARRRSLTAAFASGMPLRPRLLAFGAAAAPGIAARTLAAIESRSGHTRLKRPVPRGTQSL
jgi:GT2 family glycosyltransferase